MSTRIVGFLVAIGLGLGLGLLYGWVINPVKYVDTTPDTLKSEYKADYVLMVAEVYQREQDPELAVRRLALLGSQSPVDMIGRAILEARRAGYADADLALMGTLLQAVQSWSSSPAAMPTSGALP